MPDHPLVDVHAHICDPDFDEDRTDVLTRARNAGVEAIVAVGENLGDSRKNVELAKVYPMLKAAAGLYPTVLDLDQADEMVAFIRLNRSHLVAIGEVGLDYWVVKEKSQKEVQREIFKRFVELSKALDLPLNIHSRSAGRHAIALLLENSATQVQMHAFDGKAGAALPAVEAGYFFSIPPSVIRSRQKQKLVKRLPLACLLVETDSPVLGPIPAMRNEPANLSISIQTIAQIKNVPEEAVMEAVSDNTRRLYGVW
ncbi:TatD family hydrolase [Desulfosarcina sp.]|uniref:TatD family hydrolase n=1 Tax=Desulfosarcina sp. TaxID=2027861 RepID=UPI0029A9CB3A|nr:TatD family hydrolase [Desulfosarcina sp.]MDX2451218.1 TatD family hydrolase [Desulfosarcina sp.]MDX2489048.1 TatD family hydrolase [Desulfosarcina sp.]